MSGPVFRLSQKIGCHKARVGRVIRQNQHFARPWKQIHGNQTKEEPLGSHHIGVARAKHLLHPGNRACAVSHRCNGLSAAHPVNLRRAGRPRHK